MEAVEQATQNWANPRGACKATVDHRIRVAAVARTRRKIQSLVLKLWKCGTTYRKSHSPSLLGERELDIPCDEPYCHLMFARTAEMNRHFRTAHTSSDIPQQPYECPEVTCHKTYKAKGHWLRHIKAAHPQIPATYH